MPPDLDLNKEAQEIIERIVAEKDTKKAQELTQLFNDNQNKKTMIRVNKLSDLLDTITDQALVRFTARPDEISNKELSCHQGCRNIPAENDDSSGNGMSCDKHRSFLRIERPDSDSI